MNHKNNFLKYSKLFAFHNFYDSSGCLGGWRQRKFVDPSLLHFFFDHWLFAWLPKKFRTIMRCGIEENGCSYTLEMKEQNGGLRTSSDMVRHFF